MQIQLLLHHLQGVYQVTAAMVAATMSTAATGAARTRAADKEAAISVKLMLFKGWLFTWIIALLEAKKVLLKTSKANRSV
jgi:hypothetical protein